MEKAIEKALKEKLQCQKVSMPRGAFWTSLNQCILFETDRGKFFVKVNKRFEIDMFAAEARGLKAISEMHTLKVPTPYLFEDVNGGSFLVLEYLNLIPHAAESQRKLGQHNSSYHQQQSPNRYKQKYYQVHHIK